MEGVDPALLKEFETHYTNGYGSASRYLHKVCHILEGSDGLENHGVNGAKITFRMKEIASAKASVSRRNRDRIQRSKLRKENHDKFVAEFGRRWELKDEEVDAECTPFSKLDEVLQDMHDLAGVRIALQFPQENLKVLRYLHENFIVNSVRQKRRPVDIDTWDLPRRDSNVQSAIENMEESSRMNMFPGYRAIHVILKLKDSDVDDQWSGVHTWLQVEVQIGTVFMYAWSEVEHDLLYKNTKLADGAMTENIKNIVDMINGIAMAADSGLRQLATSMIQYEDARARDSSARAEYQSELDTWLFRCWKAHGLPENEDLKLHGWRYLEKLFTALKLMERDTYRKLEEMLDSVSQRLDKSCWDRYLPLLILQTLCTEPDQAEPRPRSNDLFDMARELAFTVVHSINMAVYFDEAEEFVNRTTWKLDKRMTVPSLSDFFDILHPTHPRIGYTQALVLKDYCEKVLKIHEFHGFGQKHCSPTRCTQDNIEVSSRQIHEWELISPGIQKKIDHDATSAASPTVLKKTQTTMGNHFDGSMKVQYYHLDGGYLDRPLQRLHTKRETWHSDVRCEVFTRLPDAVIARPQGVKYSNVSIIVSGWLWKMLDPDGQDCCAAMETEDIQETDIKTNTPREKFNPLNWLPDETNRVARGSAAFWAQRQEDKTFPKGRILYQLGPNDARNYVFFPVEDDTNEVPLWKPMRTFNSLRWQLARRDMSNELSTKRPEIIDKLNVQTALSTRLHPPTLFDRSQLQEVLLSLRRGDGAHLSSLTIQILPELLKKCDAYPSVDLGDAYSSVALNLESATHKLAIAQDAISSGLFSTSRNGVKGVRKNFFGTRPA